MVAIWSQSTSSAAWADFRHLAPLYGFSARLDSRERAEDLTQAVTWRRVAAHRINHRSFRRVSMMKLLMHFWGVRATTDGEKLARRS
jgi:hypothetical protein